MTKKYEPPPFRGFWLALTPDEKQALAKTARIPYTQLSNLANGHRRADISTLKKICNSDHRITARMLRPDLPD